MSSDDEGPRSVYFTGKGANRKRAGDDPIYEPEHVVRKRIEREAKEACEGRVSVGSAGELAAAVKKLYGKQSGDAEETQQPGCITGTLKPHQLNGLKWLRSLYEARLGGILGDYMGVGKTLQAVSLVASMAAASELTPTKPPVLIIVPLSTIQGWMAEFEKFAPQLSVLNYTGTKDERATMRHAIEKDLVSKKVKKADIYVPGSHVLLTTLELLKLDDYFVTAFKYPLVIVDEAHKLKSPKVAQFFNVAQRRCGLAHVPRRILLTGTPLQNSMSDLWSLLNIICPKLFHDCESFTGDWFGKVQTSKQEAGLISQILSYTLLRRTNEVISLPPKTELVLQCPPSPMQSLLYTSVLSKTMGGVLGQKRASSLRNTVLQLRKICCHPYMIPSVEKEPFELGEHIVANSGKLALLDKLLKELKAGGHRVLVFSQFTSMLDVLQDYLFHRDYSVERLDGSLRASDRFDAVQSFNTEGGAFVFLLSTRAGGLGLNLTTADTVVFFDNDWNPQVDLQAQQRVHRIGQTKPVTIYRMVTKGTIEEIMLSRALKKMDLSNAVLDEDASARDPNQVPSVELLELIKAGAADLPLEGGDGAEAAATPPRTLADVLISNGPGDAAAALSPEYKLFLETGIATLLSKAERVDHVAHEEGERPHMTYDGVDYAAMVKAGEEKLKKLEEMGVANRCKLDKGAVLMETQYEAAAAAVVVQTPAEKEAARQQRHAKKWAAGGYTTRLVEPAPGFEADAVHAFLSTLPTQARTVAPGQEQLPAILEETGSLNTLSSALIHVQGDVTHPGRNKTVLELHGAPLLDGFTKVDIIIAPASNSGSWPDRGLFGALSKLSNRVGEQYEAAKDQQDLRLGDVHLVKVSKKLCVAIAVCMRQQQQTVADPVLLEAGLRKLHAAGLRLVADNIVPVFHTPHFGQAASWFQTEKYFKKHLSAFPVFVYYHKAAPKKRHPDPVVERPAKKHCAAPAVPDPSALPGGFMLTSMDLDS